jgi:hypothetical protein
MAWFLRKRFTKTYHCVGWTARDPSSGVFRNVPLPGKCMMRVMDSRVHQAALESAGEKLVELGRKSGKNIAT